MVEDDRSGLSWRFALFVLVSLLGTALLFIMAMATVSFILSFLPGAPDSEPVGIGETVTVLFLGIVMATIMAMALTPILLPLGLLAWVVVHRISFGRIGTCWRYRAAAVASALAGCIGITPWLVYYSQIERWYIPLAFMVPTSMIAALIGVLMIYPQARKEAM